MTLKRLSNSSRIIFLFHTETVKQINVLLQITAQIYLVKNGVLGLEASAGKLDNLLIGARLLPSKLIAWESQDLKAYKTTHGNRT